MEEIATTKNGKHECIECKNEILVSDKASVGDVVECEYCGIEYEIMEKLENDEFRLQIIEEEK